MHKVRERSTHSVAQHFSGATMTPATIKSGLGRDETYWTPMLETLPLLTDSLPLSDPLLDYVLLLAPHPDDEVLACAGLLQRCNQSGRHLEIWMITDGEACFGNEADTREVAARRRSEAGEARRRLGIECTVRWLGFPDTQVSHYQYQLRELLLTHLRARVRHAHTNAGTLLIAPPPFDGHPDHDCIGAVAREVAVQQQLLLLQYPIWMWHSGSAAALQKNNVVRMGLSAAEEIRKRDAIAAFSSQIQSEHGPAVLPRSVLRHFRRPFEVLFVEDFRAAATSELTAVEPPATP